MLLLALFALFLAGFRFGLCKGRLVLAMTEIMILNGRSSTKQFLEPGCKFIRVWANNLYIDALPTCGHNIRHVDTFGNFFCFVET